jgi:hypothetical protein
MAEHHVLLQEMKTTRRTSDVDSMSSQHIPAVGRFKVFAMVIVILRYSEGSSFDWGKT